MLFIAIISWKGASCFNRGCGGSGGSSDWEASLSNGGGGGGSKKLLDGRGGVPPAMPPPPHYGKPWCADHAFLYLKKSGNSLRLCFYGEKASAGICTFFCIRTFCTIQNWTTIEPPFMSEFMHFLWVSIPHKNINLFFLVLFVETLFKS